MKPANIIAIVALVGAAACDGGTGQPAAAVPGSDGTSGQNAPAWLVEHLDYFGQLYGDNNDAFIDVGLISLKPCPARSDQYTSACLVGITLDGEPASAADFRIGYMAEVHGTMMYPVNPPPAPQITGKVVLDMQRMIVGPVDAVDPAHLQLKVLGQRVYVDDNTQQEATDLSSIAGGELLTVSGHVAAGGQILATRIERYAGDGPFLLRGILTALPGNRVSIGDIEVDLSSASRQGFPAGTPFAGDAVVVFASQLPENGTLIADTVRNTGADWTLSAGSGESRVGLRGFVTAVRSPNDFDVAGHTIREIELCGYCGWPHPEPLRVGSFVDVVMKWGPPGAVYLAPSTSHRLGVVGTIEAIDPEVSTITILGFQIQVSPATQLNEDLQLLGTNLAFDDFSLGDMVTISGGAIGSVMAAGTIARRGNGYRITSIDYIVDLPAIYVAGQTILTDNATHVFRCDRSGPQDLSALTAQYDAPVVLTMTVDPESSPLVASVITLCAYSWTEI